MTFHILKIFLVGAAFLGVASFSYFTLPNFFSSEYSVAEVSEGATSEVTSVSSATDIPSEPVFVVTHIEIPDAVKAIYMTQCVAGTRDFRKRLVDLVEETELNSIIIDIKDFTGKLSFPIDDNPLLEGMLSDRCHARDMREFIGTLHDKGIYVIGRITVFQDPYYAQKYPHLAVQKESDRSVWEDYKGLNFIDPGAKEAWDHIVRISKESYDIGFDELNYDYIRYPSDGNMRDIYFPITETEVNADPDFGKAKVLRNFFAYLNSEMRDTGAVLSADLFGMTTTNRDDLNIGQILEYAAPYFDYLAPMVYPSHYPRGFNGWQNPNEHVYDIVKFSMDRGVEKLIAASSSPLKLRPWLQDFNYGGTYGAVEVRAQIQATYDAGLTSWMLWDSANTYTREALNSSD